MSSIAEIKTEIVGEITNNFMAYSEKESHKNEIKKAFLEMEMEFWGHYDKELENLVREKSASSGCGGQG